MVGETLAFILSREEGLDFVVHLSFIILFFVFLDYLFKGKYKSKEERNKTNKITLLIFLFIILMVPLYAITILLFFPSIPLSLEQDKMLLPIVILIFLIAMFWVDNVKKKKLKSNK